MLHAPKTSSRKNSGFQAFGRFFLRPERERYGINTMTRIFGGKPLSLKHMAQMAAAFGANNFRPFAVCVGHAAHGPRNFRIKTGPAAAGIKFIFTFKKRRTALAAHIRPFRFVAAILAAKRGFRPFIQNDTGFFFTQWFHTHLLSFNPTRLTGGGQRRKGIRKNRPEKL